MGRPTVSLSLGNSSSNIPDYTTSSKVETDMIHRKWSELKILTLVASVMVSTACATFNPPDPNGPRSNSKPYPVEAAPANIAVSNSAWQRLLQSSSANTKTSPSLNPSTATIDSLPSPLSGAIFLPKVGDNSKQTEEHTRESLRRFITAWPDLIGADLNELSLVERVDESSGIKLASYEQKPVRYPLRGNFGKLLIRFNSDGRVVELSSSCIPDVDKLQTALSNFPLPDDRDEVLSKLKGTTFLIKDATGPHQFNVPANSQMEIRDLVMYAVPAESDPSVIQAYLAWEISWPDGPIKTLYLDAVNELVIAGS